MTNLVYMYHADMLESKSLPSVKDWSIEMLLPIVFSGKFLGESEMEKREEVHQLEIGLVGFRFATHLGHITANDVAIFQIFKLFTQRAAG